MPWQTARKDPAYGRADWKRARLECLRRARWRCQIKLEGCKGAASEADHIDGLENDPGHQRLRAACRPCHLKVTADQGNAARGASTAADPQPRPRTTW